MAKNLFRRRFYFQKLNDQFSILQEKKTELFGLYNRKTQRFDIPLIYEFMDADFSKSQLILALNKDGFYGYLNKNNEILLPFHYEDASKFWNGFAYISRFYEENNLGLEYQGVIDEKGNIILPVEYDAIYIQHPDHYAIVKKNGKYGIITLNEEIILPFEFDYIETFNSNSPSLFECTQNSKTGIFDVHSKKFIIPIELHQTEECYINSEGDYHILRKNNLDALIKITNCEIMFITDYIYEYIDQTEMPQNRLRVKKNGLYGVIDMDGNLIIPFEYQFIYSSKKKIAAIKDEKEYVFDLNGTLTYTF